MHDRPAYPPVLSGYPSGSPVSSYSAEANVYSYEIDADDRIVFCSGNWDDFASQNDGAHLAFESIKGQSVWDHISCDRTVGLYQRIFASARAGKPVQFFLRCDSPTVRRMLHVSVSPTIDGRVRTSIMLFRADERDPVHTVLCEHAGDAGDDCYTLCTWCNKVCSDGWHEIEDIVADRNSRGSQNPPAIRHGICDPCHDRIDRQLGTAH